MGQAIVILTTPIITRFYNPGEMGLLGIFMAFIGFVSVGVSLRYDMVIASVKSDHEADYLLASSIIFTVLTSIIAGFALLIMIRYNFLSYRMLPEWSVLVAVFLLIFTGCFSSLRFWFVRLQRFDIIARALVYQGVGRAVVPVACGPMQIGWIGLMLGEFAGRILGLGRMIRVAWPAMKISMSPFSFDTFTSTLRRNWKSPAVLLPSSLLDSLAAMIPLPVISYLFGSESAGQFLLVQRISSLPSGLIATSVADVFHPSIAKTRWNEPNRVRSVLSGVTRSLAMTSCAIYIPVILVSPFIFGFIFGDDWSTAGICMAIISPLSMVSLVVSPVSRLLLVADRIELKFLYDLFSLIVPISSLFLMHSFGYDFFSCLSVYISVYIAGTLMYYGLIWWVSGSITA